MASAAAEEAPFGGLLRGVGNEQDAAPIDRSDESRAEEARRSSGKADARSFLAAIIVAQLCWLAALGYGAYALL